MEEEEDDRLETITLDLFDLYWFRRSILSNLPPPPPPSPPPPPTELEDAEFRTSSPPPSSLLRRRILHRRSLSDELSPSPMLQIQPPKLQTILSGKESSVGDEIERFEASSEKQRRWRKRRDRRRKKRIEGSKSLSDLEFEELKGFMDLGFTFSDADSDPRLMEIVPGLQRLKVGADDRQEAVAAGAAASSASSSADDVSVLRPYLSEAWDAAEEESPVRNIMIPLVGSEVNLKDQLRFWAHAVASTVR